MTYYLDPGEEWPTEIATVAELKNWIESTDYTSKVSYAAPGNDITEGFVLAWAMDLVRFGLAPEEIHSIKFLEHHNPRLIDELWAKYGPLPEERPRANFSDEP